MAKNKLYGERWKVVRSLKEGGQSWVYRAVDVSGAPMNCCYSNLIGAGLFPEHSTND